MAGIEALMETELITASPGESVADVAERMGRNKVGAVLVVRDRALCGLFSERDLLNRVIARRLDPKATAVGDVATGDVVSIDVAQPLKQVLAIFRRKRFRHLPVLRDGEPVGILSTRDFLDYLVEGLERYIERSKYSQDIAEGNDPYDHFGGSYGR
jgi:CBS domain-containing protein